jgi:hypothetical protein
MLYRRTGEGWISLSGLSPLSSNNDITTKIQRLNNVDLADKTRTSDLKISLMSQRY